jgi:hypothetical protein
MKRLPIIVFCALFMMIEGHASEEVLQDSNQLKHVYPKFEEYKTDEIVVIIAYPIPKEELKEEKKQWWRNITNKFSSKESLK